MPKFVSDPGYLSVSSRSRVHIQDYADFSGTSLPEVSSCVTVDVFAASDYMDLALLEEDYHERILGIVELISLHRKRYKFSGSLMLLIW